MNKITETCYKIFIKYMPLDMKQATINKSKRNFYALVAIFNNKNRFGINLE